MRPFIGLVFRSKKKQADLHSQAASQRRPTPRLKPRSGSIRPSAIFNQVRSRSVHAPSLIKPSLELFARHDHFAPAIADKLYRHAAQFTVSGCTRSSFSSLPSLVQRVETIDHLV